MQVSICLLDAALNNDELAQSQISDILEDYSFKRWPQLKFEWVHEKRKSICSALGITIYRSPGYGQDYYSVYLHTRRLNEKDSLEDAIEWVENYFSECFKNCYVRS
jgi:hypothetical protein